MILQPGEHGIASDQVTGLWAGGNMPGRLFLTSRRLVFEGSVWEPGAGFVPRTLVDLQLSQISNLVTVPGRDGKQLLRVESGPAYILTFVTPVAHHWASSTHEAMGRASLPPPPGRELPPPPPPPPPPSIVVNVPQPTVYLHCKHCGTLNGSGTVRCGSCGAAL